MRNEGFVDSNAFVIKSCYFRVFNPTIPHFQYRLLSMEEAMKMKS
jgi:hypothetical protein